MAGHNLAPRSTTRLTPAHPGQGNLQCMVQTILQLMLVINVGMGRTYSGPSPFVCCSLSLIAPHALAARRPIYPPSRQTFSDLHLLNDSL